MATFVTLPQSSDDLELTLTIIPILYITSEYLGTNRVLDDKHLSLAIARVALLLVEAL